jgi:hypothetical protein
MKRTLDSSMVLVIKTSYLTWVGPFALFRFRINFWNCEPFRRFVGHLGLWMVTKYSSSSSSSSSFSLCLFQTSDFSFLLMDPFRHLVGLFGRGRRSLVIKNVSTSFIYFHTPTRRVPPIGIPAVRMMWAGHLARMGEMRNACKIVVGKREEKRL